MKNILALLLFVVSVLFFSSCSHSLYTPPEANLLMLSEENDLKVSAGAGLAREHENTYNFQLGYSPVKHLGIALNYFQVGSGGDPAFSVNDDLSDRVSSLLGEAAVGTYFKKEINAIKDEGTITEAAVNNYLVLDAYAGYGRSNLRKAFRVGDIDFNAQHYFLQAGVHFQSKLLGLSYTLRGVFLDYLDGEVNGQVSEEILQSVSELSASPFTFLESSVRLRAGREKVNFFVSRNWMSSPLGNETFDSSSFSWHAGVVLDLNAIFKGKN